MKEVETVQRRSPRVEVKTHPVPRGTGLVNDADECPKCRAPMVAVRATDADPFSYTRLSGLTNVFLVGIKVHRCSNAKCGVELPEIPQIEKLHEVIAKTIVRKPGLLRGEELRFLRKWAGFPAKEFAVLVGTTPEHLSRFETGKRNNLGEPADRLARAIAAAARDGDEARQILLHVARTLSDGSTSTATSKSVFQRDGHSWRLAA